MIVQLLREALTTALLLCAPLLAVAFIIGALVSVLQTMTSMQDATLGFVPKILGVLAALFVASPWILTKMLLYTRSVFGNLDALAR